MEALTATSAALRGMLDRLSVGALLLRRDGSIAFMNAAAERWVARGSCSCATGG